MKREKGEKKHKRKEKEERKENIHDGNKQMRHKANVKEPNLTSS
jgi:hypothetical protein